MPLIKLSKIRRKDEKPLGEGDAASLASAMSASNASIKSIGSASEY